MLERCPESKPKFPALLHNYKLVFLGYSRLWHGGVASIKSFTGERVPGAVYDLTERDLRRLDKYKGLPEHYHRINIKVTSEDDDLLEAVTYIKKGQPEENPPSKEYLTVIRQGYREWGIE